ncbi:MAG TPA: LysR substrate-binding domain-containing protein [Burkholderiaceae bacterium]|nr:LysR substrate-binding domain-containing protein [Burkholderiaceae bacterium]
MTDGRNALTPEALAMVDAIARTGSFAAAARELGRVPSALTYQVRQLEEALDALLFDRSSRQARLTAAGEELLDEGRRVLAELDAVTNRVRRVASGWETRLTITYDGIISRSTLFDLIEAFYALKPGAINGPDRGPGTRLCLRTEVLAGTWEALLNGQTDLTIGARIGADPASGVQSEPLGDMAFVWAVAPRHPLAAHQGSVTDVELARHRAIAVADATLRLSPATAHLVPGQDVLTVPNLEAKLEAQLRGLGCGLLPEPMARPLIASGHLVAVRLQRPTSKTRFCYAWRASSRRATSGMALKWWLSRLRTAATRRALLERYDVR